VSQTLRSAAVMLWWGTSALSVAATVGVLVLSVFRCLAGSPVWLTVLRDQWPLLLFLCLVYALLIILRPERKAKP
jgi:hypothetical protein